MNSSASKFGVEGVRNFHRGANGSIGLSTRPRHRKWVFAGMLAAAAGVLVWRCVSGNVRR